MKVPANGFVDDVAMAARAKTFAETHERLKAVIEGENGVLKWAKTHSCTFGLPKWQLLDCTAKTRDAPHPKHPNNSNKKIRIPDVGDSIMIGGRPESKCSTVSCCLWVCRHSQLSSVGVLRPVDGALKLSAVWVRLFMTGYRDGPSGSRLV
jgi:hypothetical protein